MKINCLSCGHKVEVDEAYDDYEGPIKCLVCSALLELKAEDGRIKSVKVMVDLPYHLSEEHIETESLSNEQE